MSPHKTKAEHPESMFHFVFFTISWHSCFSSSAWYAPFIVWLSFLRRGEPGCFHCTPCFLASEWKWWMQASFGHNSMHKFLRVIFIVRQEILRNIKLVLLLILVNILGIHLAETLDIPKILVKIDWTSSKIMPICLALLCRLPLLWHMIRLCTSSTFFVYCPNNDNSCPLDHK